MAVIRALLICSLLLSALASPTALCAEYTLSAAWTRPEGGAIRAGRFPIGGGWWRGGRSEIMIRCRRLKDPTAVASAAIAQSKRASNGDYDY
jgi:hypothetical protein